MAFDYKIEDLVKSHNIAEMVDEEDLTKISGLVYDEWQLDATSRLPWEERMGEALKLALQVREKKTFPWPDAANVKFPLITIAALQFQSRAYPALLPNSDIVKVSVVGEDISGEKTARANRIADFMSYQLLEEDESWERHMDEVLMVLPIVGCAFKKSWFDTTKKHNISRHIQAKDIYLPYYAKSIEDAPRITEKLYLSKNEIHKNQKSGIWLDIDLGAISESPTTVLQEDEDDAVARQRAFHSSDTGNLRTFLEQHRYLDLDGDGYEEPYIVTIDESSKKVLRIVASYYSDDITRNKKGQVIDIKREEFYTKFSFIPSPDGGIYDLGFGILLGSLNESVNTLLNQLLDSGTMAITAGGFLGRGAKLKSGDNSFRPFEWKRVDSVGDDLRKNIVPLETREPSQVLFMLLELLINYGERIGMATDPQVGINPGQNTPAETSRNTLIEGQRVFNSIFKRLYRSLKEEFKKLYDLNSKYLEDTNMYYSVSKGQDIVIQRQDFSSTRNYDIRPAADPAMATKEQKIMQAMLLRQAAMERPDKYNGYEVERRYLTALGIDNIEPVLPDPKGENAIQSQPDSKVMIESMRLEQKKAEWQSKIQLQLFDLIQEAEYLRADIAEKEARTVLLYAQAKGQQDNIEITALQSAVALAKTRQEGIIRTIEVLKDLAGFQREKKELVNDIASGVDGVEEASDND